MLNTSGCSQGCTNYSGSFECTCSDGFTMNSGGMMCSLSGSAVNIKSSAVNIRSKVSYVQDCDVIIMTVRTYMYNRLK